MGNYTSKLFSHHNEPDAKTKSSVKETNSCSSQKIRLCTPPVTKRKLPNDPRSATMEIIRTPIEVTCTPPEVNRRVASALPKYLQGKRYLETDFDASVIVTTPVKCIPDPRSPNVSQQRTPIMVKSVGNYFSPVVTVNQAPEMDTPTGAIVTTLDPRSPAIDFDRTPILKPKSTERLAPSSEDKRVASSVAKTGNAILSYCETTTDYNIPEIQAISEVVSPNFESTGLNDASGKMTEESASDPINSEESSDCSEENEGQITVIRNPKVLSSYSDPIPTWTENESVEVDDNVAGKTDDIDESLGKTLDNDISEIINAVIVSTIDDEKIMTSNEKIRVWRDSTSPIINDDAKCLVGRKNTSEEIIIEFDDDAVAKNSKINTAKMAGKDDDKSKNPTKKKEKKMQQHIKCENKVFNEEKKIFQAEGKYPVDPSLNRTPLGNRSNNHKPQSRLSAKSPQQLLRNKGLSARTIQQENTPPTERFISKIKPHGIQWDPDTTVII